MHSAPAPSSDPRQPGLLRRLFGKLAARPADGPLPRIVSEAEFIGAVVAAEQPALVLFDSPGSKAAARLGQALHRLAARRRDLVIAVADIAALPQLPQRYGVTGLPTLLLFRNGQIVARRLGESDAAALDVWVDRKLAN